MLLASRSAYFLITPGETHRIDTCNALIRLSNRVIAVRVFTAIALHNSTRACRIPRNPVLRRHSLVSLCRGQILGHVVGSVSDALVAVAEVLIDELCECGITRAWRGEADTADFAAGEGALDGDTGDGGEGTAERVSSHQNACEEDDS